MLKVAAKLARMEASCVQDLKQTTNLSGRQGEKTRKQIRLELYTRTGEDFAATNDKIAEAKSDAKKAKKEKQKAIELKAGYPSGPNVGEAQWGTVAVHGNNTHADTFFFIHYAC